jgi:hypothetical protein
MRLITSEERVNHDPWVRSHNEETIGKIEQKHPDMPPIKAFDKEKLLAIQKQVVEGMTRNANSQQRISGPVKRQVTEA